MFLGNPIRSPSIVAISIVEGKKALTSSLLRCSFSSMSHCFCEGAYLLCVMIKS